MRWIYILRCEDEFYYVGQTSRLYRRFWEHERSEGGVNTFIYTPAEIVAIYKVSNIIKFINYNEKIININNDEKLKSSYDTGFNHPKYVLNNWDNINDDNIDVANESENNIAECMMMHDKNNWTNIRGGKYVRFDCKYKFPNNQYIKELPLCNCGLPCDIKKQKNKNSLFLRGAKKNMWEEFKEQFEIEDEPCNFYREYLTDMEIRVEDKENFNKRQKNFGELMKKSDWLRNIPCEEDGELGECILCNTYVWTNKHGEFKNNGMLYCNERRLLCKNCFLNKNEELKKNYSLIGNNKCLINI